MLVNIHLVIVILSVIFVGMVAACDLSDLATHKMLGDLAVLSLHCYESRTVVNETMKSTKEIVSMQVLFLHYFS